MTSSDEGVHSIHTVNGGGSSIALSSTFVVRSSILSASSTTTTRHGPLPGETYDLPTSSRVRSTVMKTPRVATDSTSGCLPSITVWQAWHWPHPGSGPVHSRAAANALAATDLPEPGGPVTSQAWAMAESAPTAVFPASSRAAAAAFSSWARTARCPTSSSKTLTARRPRAGGLRLPTPRPRVRGPFRRSAHAAPSRPL